MRKIVFVLFLLTASLMAQMLSIDNFSAEVFSRATKKPVTINLKMMIEGRYVEEESYKIIDALNIVVGSFYLEDLITSQGKQKLKEAIKSYTTSKYSIDIDNIYILKLQSQPNTQEIIDALKKEGMCVK
ncbi:MAG: flagellar basal body-associated FliL family protein [Sulfurospirillum sp.]